jgi:hypothetical protein
VECAGEAYHDWWSGSGEPARSGRQQQPAPSPAEACTEAERRGSCTCRMPRRLSSGAPGGSASSAARAICPGVRDDSRSGSPPPPTLPPPPSPRLSFRRALIALTAETRPAGRSEVPRGRQARLASRLQAAAGRPAKGRGGRSGSGLRLRLISHLTTHNRLFFSPTEQHPHNHTHNAICNLHLWCQCV